VNTGSNAVKAGVQGATATAGSILKAGVQATLINKFISKPSVPAQQPLAAGGAGIDPTTGLPLAGASTGVDPTTGLPLAGTGTAIDPTTGLPASGAPAGKYLLISTEDIL